MAIWRHVASWITKATRAQAHALVCAPIPTNTRKHTDRNIYDLSRQQLLRERASMLRYTYIACRVKYLFCVFNIL